MAQRSRLLSPTANLRRNAITKGLIRGDRKWVWIGGAFWVFHIIRRAVGRSEAVVTIERLTPGQWMSIRTISMATSDERKAAKATKPS